MGYVDGAIDAPPSATVGAARQVSTSHGQIYALFEEFVEALTRIRALAAA
jgi:hypothetical protein